MNVKPKILVVEDEIAIRELIHQMLSKEGFEVIMVASGEEAIAQVANVSSLFLVISDMRLPGMDGASLCRKIRDTNPLIRFLAITGYGDTFTLSELRKAGADEYFAKPLNVEEFILSCKYYLKQSLRWRQLPSGGISLFQQSRSVPDV